MIYNATQLFGFSDSVSQTATAVRCDVVKQLTIGHTDYLIINLSLTDYLYIRPEMACNCSAERSTWIFVQDDDIHRCGGGLA